jgi:hypothetical protein
MHQPRLQNETFEAVNASTSSQDRGDRELTNDQRNAILQALLQRSENRILNHGAVKDIAQQFDVGRNTVGRIWKRGIESLDKGNNAMDASSRKKSCGQKKKSYSLDQYTTIPLNQRGTVRSAAAATGIPKSTFHGIIKSGAIRAHSNAVKPYLTPENMDSRVEFCKRHIDMDRAQFHDMMDVIHVDEKWFYMTQNSRKCYILEGEKEPHRATKSKRFSTKVMFLAAVARPRWDAHRNQQFNGKLGIWPFITTEAAKRSSRNRSAGTLVRSNRNIKIQQDNARPHIKPTDPDFVAAVARSNFNIQLLCQPANSPDMNVLDLGYFNSIQSLQHEAAPKTIDELVEAVYQSFERLKISKLTNILLTLQLVMEQCILHHGNNDFKIPHMSKQKLEREGRLPLSISCSSMLMDTLNTNETSI